MRGLAVAVVIVLAAGEPVGASGVAADSAAAKDEGTRSLRSDFNNDGFADLAVGVPFEDVGSVQSAGAVNVLYGGGSGLAGRGSQFFTQNSAGVPDSAETDDEFGRALVAGDFNNDGFADLAVGAPEEDVGSVQAAGAVNVLYGGASGLTGSGSQFFTQDTTGVADSPELGDDLGFSLTAGDFDNDGYADLAISVVEPFGTGAVHVLHGGRKGLTGRGSRFFTQDTRGVGSSAAGGDQFGFALAAGDFDNDGFADLAVGVPGEADFQRAGAVNVLYGGGAGLTGSGSQLFTQDTPGVGGNAEPDDAFGQALAAGDFDHDGYTDLAITASGEDVGRIVSMESAGAVNVLYGGAAGLSGPGSRFFTQDTPGVGGSAEPFDGFGAALSTGDFDRDGFADLAIGVPSEAVGSINLAGAVNVLYGGASGLTGSGSQFFTQDTPGVGSSAERFDIFGDALATGDFDRDGFADLAVGVTSETVGSIEFAGAVNVLYGAAAGLSGSGSQFFTQDTPGVGSIAEAGDQFGRVLAGSGR